MRNGPHPQLGAVYYTMYNISFRSMYDLVDGVEIRDGEGGGGKYCHGILQLLLNLWETVFQF